MKQGGRGRREEARREREERGCSKVGGERGCSKAKPSLLPLLDAPK
jgi:hypothetical protein